MAAKRKIIRPDYRSAHEPDTAQGDEIPADAVQLDPDEARIDELQRNEVPDEEIEELFRVTDEMRTTGAVVLQFVRVLPVATAGYCGEMQPAEFTLDRVRREFGVGTYRVRCLGPRGYVPGGGKVVIAAVADKPVAVQSNVQDMLAILAADKARTSETLLKYATVLGPIIAPILANLFAPKKSEVSELVSGMAALKALQPDPPAAQSLDKQLDTLAGVMAKLKDLSGDDKPTVGSTWIDLIREIAPGAVNALAARLPPPRTGMPGPPMPQLIAPSGPTSSATPDLSAASVGSQDAPAGGPAQGNGEPVGMLALIPWLRATLESLVVQAARDRDPELYAEVTLDNLPPGTDQKQLQEFIARADWWQVLQQFYPPVTPYEGWMQKYRDAVLALIEDSAPQLRTPDRVDVPPDEGAGGDGM